MSASRSVHQLEAGNSLRRLLLEPCDVEAVPGQSGARTASVLSSLAEVSGQRSRAERWEQLAMQSPQLRVGMGEVRALLQLPESDVPRLVAYCAGAAVEYAAASGHSLTSLMSEVAPFDSILDGSLMALDAASASATNGQGGAHAGGDGSGGPTAADGFSAQQSAGLRVDAADMNGPGEGGDADAAAAADDEQDADSDDPLDDEKERRRMQLTSRLRQAKEDLASGRPSTKKKAAFTLPPESPRGDTQASKRFRPDLCDTTAELRALEHSNPPLVHPPSEAALAQIQHFEVHMRTSSMESYVEMRDIIRRMGAQWLLDQLHSIAINRDLIVGGYKSKATPLTTLFVSPTENSVPDRGQFDRRVEHMQPDLVDSQDGLESRHAQWRSRLMRLKEPAEEWKAQLASLRDRLLTAEGTADLESNKDELLGKDRVIAACLDELARFPAARLQLEGGVQLTLAPMSPDQLHGLLDSAKTHIQQLHLLDFAASLTAAHAQRTARRQSRIDAAIQSGQPPPRPYGLTELCDADLYTEMHADLEELLELSLSLCPQLVDADAAAARIVEAAQRVGRALPPLPWTEADVQSLVDRERKQRVERAGSNPLGLQLDEPIRSDFLLHPYVCGLYPAKYLQPAAPGVASIPGLWVELFPYEDIDDNIKAEGKAPSELLKWRLRYHSQYDGFFIRVPQFLVYPPGSSWREEKQIGPYFKPFRLPRSIPFRPWNCQADNLLHYVAVPRSQWQFDQPFNNRKFKELQKFRTSNLASTTNDLYMYERAEWHKTRLFVTQLLPDAQKPPKLDKHVILHWLQRLPTTFFGASKLTFLCDFFSKMTLANTAPDRGCLAYGPPGTGKTAILTYLIQRSGLNAIHDCVTGSDFVSAYVGETEANIRSIFKRPGNCPWLPGVLLIDEVDALIPDRKQLQGDSSSQASVVNTVIATFGGATDTKNLHLLCATNFLLRIDDAMKRPGRMDTKQFIGLPSPDDRARFFGKYAGTLPPLSALVSAHMKSLTTNFSGANMEGLVEHIMTRRKLDVQKHSPELSEADVEQHPRVKRELTYDELNQRCLEIVRRDAIKVGGAYFPDLLSGSHLYLAEQYHARLMKLASSYATPSQHSSSTGRAQPQSSSVFANQPRVSAPWLSGLIISAHKVLDRTGVTLSQAFSQSASPDSMRPFSLVEVQTKRYEGNAVVSDVEVFHCLPELQVFYAPLYAPRAAAGVRATTATSTIAAAREMQERQTAARRDEQLRKQWEAVLPQVRSFASLPHSAVFGRLVASFARFSCESDIFAFRILNERQFYGKGVFEEKDIQRLVEEELEELEQYPRYLLFVDVDSLAVTELTSDTGGQHNSSAEDGSGDGGKVSAKNQQLIQALLGAADTRAVVNATYTRVIVLHTSSAALEKVIKARLNWPDPTAAALEARMDEILHCIHCHADFNWKDNEEGACEWHSGGVQLVQIRPGGKRTSKAPSTLLAAAQWLDEQRDQKTAQQLRGGQPSDTPQQREYVWTCCGKTVAWKNDSEVHGVADGERCGRHQKGTSEVRNRKRL